MVDVKSGVPFGLDPAAIKAIDWPLALKRVDHDLRSDFIYAPHLAFIYSKAGDLLIAQVTSELKARMAVASSILLRPGAKGAHSSRPK